MTIPMGVPYKIGDADVRMGFWGMPRKAGDPRRVGGTFTVVNGEGALLLDAFIGPQGEPGVNAPIFDWEYDSTVENVGDLPNVNTLDETDDGRAWLIGTTWHVYVDAAGASGEYRQVQAGIPGPQGPTPDVDFTAKLRKTTNPNDLSIIVTPSGTIDSPNFELQIPTAPLIGPAGPSTSIRNAPDYYNAVAPQDGQGVVWSEARGRFVPGDLSPTAATMHSIPHGNFIDYTGSATRQLIASLDLDAMPYAWYPHVSGHVRWKKSNFLSSVQVEFEVRIGTGGTGESAPLCGKAPFDPSVGLLDSVTVAYIDPHFSDSDDATRAVSPDSSAARVPAGQQRTVFVFAHKVGGSGNYEFKAADIAQITLLQFPVS